MRVHGYEVTVGLDFRCRLPTRTKLFSPGPTSFGAASNAEVDGYTLATPGSLPALNRRAVELAIRLVLVLGAEIEPISRWVRKHYFDRTLPKGYQVTQLASPLARAGVIEAAGRRLGLTAIRLAEDVGELRHGSLDLNRAGAPLLEIIGEPLLLRHGPEEASAFLRALHELVEASRIFSSDLPTGALRCDVHISLGSPERPTHRACSIRDLASCAAMEAAIAAEIRRQMARLGPSTAIEPDADCCYLPEPDVPPLRIDPAWIERVRAEL